MEPITDADLLALLVRPGLERNVQDAVLDSFTEWMLANAAASDHDYVRRGIIRGEYEVDNTNRKNAALDLEGVVSVIYLENFNCFLIYSCRTMANVCKYNDVSPDVLLSSLHLFPKKCFAYTAQNLVDAYNNLLQDNFDDFAEEQLSMSKSEEQKFVDEALDKKNFHALKFRKDIQEGMKLVSTETPPGV